MSVFLANEISGFSGQDGVIGVDGSSGISGVSGFSGTSGYSGQSGSIGTTGLQGTSGFSGVSGYSGVAGAGFQEHQVEVYYAASGFSGPSSLKIGRTDVISFDATTDEAVDFSFKFPQNLDTTADITIEVGYHMATSESADVALELRYEVVGTGDDTTPASLTGTLTSTVSVNTTVEQRDVTSFTIPNTDIGTLDEQLRITLIRDADNGADTHGGEFRVENIAVRYRGIVGESGFSGEVGISGISGISGFSGFSGFSGVAGAGFQEHQVEVYYATTGFSGPANLKTGSIDVMSFDPTTDNALDFSFKFPQNLDTTADITIEIGYHMSTGQDADVALELRYEVVGTGDNATPASPTGTLTTTVDVNATLGERDVTSFTIPNSDITGVDEQIRVTLIRDADNVVDTHGGSFRVENIAVRYRGIVGESGFSGEIGLSGISGISGYSGLGAAGFLEKTIWNFFDASGFSAPSNVKVGRIDTLSFESIADNATDFSFEIPDEMDTTAIIEVVISYHMSSSNSGNVRLSLIYDVIGVDDNVLPVSPTRTLTSTLNPSDTGERRGQTAFTITDGDITATSESVRFTLLRDADHAADTHTGDFRIEGITIKYIGLRGQSGMSGISGFSSSKIIPIETIAKTLNATSDIGYAFTNEGATGEVLYELPSAVSGLNYEFHCFGFSGFSGIKVRGFSGNFIRMGQVQTVSSGFISSTDNGSNTRLLALNGSQWFGGPIVGEWDVENT